MAWIAAGLGATFVLLLVAGAVLLRSARFHRYLLGVAEERAGAALGVPVRLQNFALHPATLTVDLYGVEVGGAAPCEQTKLLQVEHVAASIRIVSVLRREWDLESIQVDHPVARVIVDNRGASNLPIFKSSGKSSGVDPVFDLGIRHAVLDRGEIYYNNQPGQLAADVRDLEFHASFNSLLQTYSGKLGYFSGRISTGSVQAVPHSLDVEFDVSRSALRLTHAEIASGASRANVQAIISNFNTPAVQASYDMTLDGNQVGGILHNSSFPAGLIRATGTLRFQRVPGRTLLDALAIEGDLASRSLEVHTVQARAAATNVAAHYALANGVITLRDLRSGLLGGNVNASGTLAIAGEEPHSKLVAALHGVSLEELRRALGRSVSTGNVALSGALNADATAEWGKSLDDLTAHTDATVLGTVKGAGAEAGRSTIPIDSAIHGTYSAKSGQIALERSYLRTSHTSLVLDGTLSRSSKLSVQLQANDLREIEVIAKLFRAPVQGSAPPALGLAGKATFSGTVTGSATAPHITGEFSAANLQLKGTGWRLVRTGIDASPSGVRLDHAELEPMSRGHIAVDGNVELNKWAFSNTNKIDVNLRASQLDVAELIKLAGRALPVKGTLGAEVTLHGSLLNPSGSGNAEFTDGEAYGQSVREVSLSFAGTGVEAHGDLSVKTPAGVITGKVSVRPQDRTYQASLGSAGIDLAKLDILKERQIAATGLLHLTASGQGTFDNPRADASMEIPVLVIQNQTISELKLQANLADRVANATLTSNAVHTSIQARAKVQLTGDYLTDATLDTQEIPLGPLLATYASEQADAISGQTEIHATLHGPLTNMNQLEAHVTVPQFKAAYGSTVQLQAVSPIRADYKNGTIEIQRSEIRGTDTDLEFQGSIPKDMNAPMSLLLKGTVNLQIAQLFDPDIRSSGEVKLNINSNGVASGANFGGQIEIADANFASKDIPVGLSHANGVLTVSRDRINIAKFEGTIGGGTVTAQGGVAYRPNLQFDLGVGAQGIRVLYPQGMRERIDANIRLSGSPASAVLGGSVNLSDVSFTPAFDLSSFASQFSGGVAAPPSQGFSQNMQLNLAVRSTSDLNLVSRALSVGGSANLQVRGTAADPVVLGRVNLSSGDIILNGNRFVLNGGTVQFVNPSETQPVVNLALGTTIQQYNITLRFEGPADQLRTQYSSDPALPQADIINLLAFGQTTEASAANASTPANQAAESLLASQVSSEVTGRVSKIAGISQLSINPVLAGSSTQGPPGAVITVQQRVTGNLFITFSSNVASTQSQTIQGQYQLSPRVAISATRDPNGGFALDTLIKKSW